MKDGHRDEVVVNAKALHVNARRPWRLAESFRSRLSQCFVAFLHQQPSVGLRLLLSVESQDIPVLAKLDDCRYLNTLPSYII